ncbi:MAG TPA: hypothetical protein VJ302_05950 [Blastocatellia bacterium]|nr:hypothetical protein [Blastocatellia bacterium]
MKRRYPSPIVRIGSQQQTEMAKLNNFQGNADSSATTVFNIRFWRSSEQISVFHQGTELRFYVTCWILIMWLDLDRGPYWLRAGKNFVFIALLTLFVKYLLGFYQTWEHLKARVFPDIFFIICLSLWSARKRAESANKDKNSGED